MHAAIFYDILHILYLNAFSIAKCFQRKIFNVQFKSLYVVYNNNQIIRGKNGCDIHKTTLVAQLKRTLPFQVYLAS